jgi:hypothetical protein
MSDAYSAADMLINEAERVVVATQFEIQTDRSRGEIIWTGSYVLEESGIVTVNVYLDEKLIYSCRDYRLSGNATLSVSTPFEIQRGDEGVHEVKVALSFAVAEESDITMLARQLAALENRVRQIEKGFNNEIEVEDAIRAELDLIFGRIDSEAQAAYIEADSYEILEPVRVELTRMFGGFTEDVKGE